VVKAKKTGLDLVSIIPRLKKFKDEVSHSDPVRDLVLDIAKTKFQVLETITLIHLILTPVNLLSRYWVVN